MALVFGNPPNFGEFVTGEDTYEYYYRIGKSTTTQTTLFSQKISAYENEQQQQAQIVYAFQSMSKSATAGVIPNSLPGGYTP